MEWKEIAQWLWIALAGLFGWNLKTTKAEIKELYAKVGQLADDKADKTEQERIRVEHMAEMKEISGRLREDVKGLHEKLDRIIERQ